MRSPRIAVREEIVRRDLNVHWEVGVKEDSGVHKLANSGVLDAQRNFSNRCSHHVGRYMTEA